MLVQCLITLGHVCRLVANDEASYRYLVESIRRFPPQERLVQMISEAGLKDVRSVQNPFFLLHRSPRTKNNFSVPATLQSQ